VAIVEAAAAVIRDQAAVVLGLIKLRAILRGAVRDASTQSTTFGPYEQLLDVVVLPAEPVRDGIEVGNHPLRWGHVIVCRV
jgi:hypothetical protein